MVGTSPILLLHLLPPARQPPANAHIPPPPPPFQIESWRQRKQGPYGSGGLLGPAVRPLEIESPLELFYTFSLAAAPRPSLLFLSPFFASKYLEPEQFFPSSAWKYGEVGVVCFTSTGQTWNQSSSGAISSIKMNSFVQKPWPASSGPPDGASCAPAFVSPAAPAAATRALL